MCILYFTVNNPNKFLMFILTTGNHTMDVHTQSRVSRVLVLRTGVDALAYMHEFLTYF